MQSHDPYERGSEKAELHIQLDFLPRGNFQPVAQGSKFQAESVVSVGR